MSRMPEYEMGFSQPNFSNNDMETDRSRQLNSIHRELTKITQAWALRRPYSPDRARELRRQAILANHANYLEHIPIYQRYAQEEGIESLDNIEPIKQKLMFPDELFKSYDQRWLDEKNFTRMNAWLSEIHCQRVNVDVTGIDSIDAWIDRLAEAGIHIVYSSGTSGNLSFIPRDAANWALFKTVSTCYLAPLLMSRNLGTPLQQMLVILACRWMPPETFVKASRRLGPTDYEAVFLDFSHGRTGNQTLEQELAPFFRKHDFLYQTQLSPSVLRLAVRGPKTEQDRQQLLALQEVVIGQKEKNYRKVIQILKQSVIERRKMFIFGTTYQYKELCEMLAEGGEKIKLYPGSMILFGGGWKSFTGEKIPPGRLMTLMGEYLGLPPERILEGYSMTEINVFTLRCEYGRFHIPPLIEPIIFDEGLEILEGNDLSGGFGFLDPLATSYPGFIVSGDEVHYINGECPCGLNGPAILEIGRSSRREVKGCGGIMASLAA
jgi:hypothetical protein